MKQENRGGKRRGAGRPSGYGEECKRVSIWCPISHVEELKSLTADFLKSLQIPKDQNDN